MFAQFGNFDYLCIGFNFTLILKTKTIRLCKTYRKAMMLLLHLSTPSTVRTR